MPYGRRLILHAPPRDADVLDAFVEACVRDGVVLVCIVGPDCERVQDFVDELVVGDGSDASRFVNTTAHPHETLDAVKAFASSWVLDDGDAGPVQEVRLFPPDAGVVGLAG